MKRVATKPIRASRIALRRERSATVRIIEAERRAEHRIFQADVRVNEIQRKAANDVMFAREDAMREALRCVAEHQDYIKYFLESAMKEIGRKMGNRFGEWYSQEIQPIDDRRQKMANAVLSAAKIDFDARIEDQKLVILKVRVPPMDFNMATDLPYSYG